MDSLKSIDTRSLYLNLFPFRAIDHQSQLLHILEQQGAFEISLSDAEKKASELEKTTGKLSEEQSRPYGKM